MLKSKPLRSWLNRNVGRRHGISSATFYKWKARRGGRGLSDTRRLKGLETENTRLKKLLTDSLLGNSILKGLLGRGHPTIGPREGRTPDDAPDEAGHWDARAKAGSRRACQALEPGLTGGRVRCGFGAARRFHMIDAIHDQTRECLALAAITSQSGARVARELDRCIRLYDKPQQNGFVESLATLSFGSTASCATNA